MKDIERNSKSYAGPCREAKKLPGGERTYKRGDVVIPSDSEDQQILKYHPDH